MPDFQAQIKELEDEMRKTQYNKATEHHFGVLRAKISKLRDKFEKASSGGKKGEGFAVKKSGDASVILVGFPSVGKSTLLNALTNAQSKTAAYAFTTLTVVPGIMKYNHAKIQILDVPGILEGAAIGRGRGKEVLAMVRNADLIVLLLDAQYPEHIDVLKKELYDFNVRINQRKPDVKLIKKSKDGISIHSTVKLSKITSETVKAILNEFKLNNADIVIREDINVDQMIDVIEGNRAYVPSVTIVSKIDLVNSEKVKEIKQITKADLMVSAEKKTNIEELKKMIYDKLNLMSIYMKEVNKKADMEEPMIVRRGCSLRGICDRVHRDFAKKFKYARIWGKSAKFPGQLVKNIEKKLEDGDVVELRIR